MNRPIYFDYAATTPCCIKALEALFKCLGTKAEFGNPHSTTHEYGWHAAEIIAESTASFAKIIAAKPAEMIWTSGATEANNLAIQGVARFYQTKGKHLVTTQIEHKAVLDVFRYLENEGFEVTYLPVQQRGSVDLALLQSALRPDTTLVSVMAVNNELGTIQPLAEIAKIVKANGSLLHTDAAQALGKIPFNVDALGVDLASFSGHKIYAPKGIGALYVRSKPRIRLKPLFYGGAQQRGLRPGTESPGLISAFAQGAEFSCQNLTVSVAKITELRDHFLQKLAKIPNLKLNTDLARAVPHIVNICFQGTDGEMLLAALKPHMAIAQGSACTSATIEASHVLRAIGLKSIDADSSFRFSFGALTTEAEISTAAKIITELF